MHRFLILSWSLLFTLSPFALAEDYCLDSELVVDQDLVWDFGAGVQSEVPLPTHRMGSLVPTNARAYFTSEPASPYMNIDFALPAKPGETYGLEYNLYRVELRVGATAPDEQLLDLDFTSGCQKDAPSVFPGQSRKAGTVKVLPRADGWPRGLELIHLRIWGRR
jgi:hypothetical protein